jgi:hypothetical protein
MKTTCAALTKDKLENQPRQQDQTKHYQQKDANNQPGIIQKEEIAGTWVTAI